jgi:hypothetical protein
MAVFHPARVVLVFFTQALLLFAASALAAETRVAFDIPDKIECHDVTPEKCAAAHPNLKVIEAKFRISASFIQGTESSVVDFAYLITSPGMRMKIQDFLPNTTLESTLADDKIEVADTSETADSTNGDAQVAYTILKFGVGKTQSNKKSESDHYKRIVPKALVLASGTTNRGHGVFYKLRPSVGASLEGAKEFTYLAIVPKGWRGDWCTFICAARANKKNLTGTSVSLAGIEQAHVGLYLAGDGEASDLAEALCRVQEANGGVLSKEMAKEATRQVETMHAATTTTHTLIHFDELLHSIVKIKPDGKEADQKLTEAKKSIADVQDRLSRLSGAAP